MHITPITKDTRLYQAIQTKHNCLKPVISCVLSQLLRASTELSHKGFESDLTLPDK